MSKWNTSPCQLRTASPIKFCSNKLKKPAPSLQITSEFTSSMDREGKLSSNLTLMYSHWSTCQKANTITSQWRSSRQNSNSKEKLKLKRSENTSTLPMTASLRLKSTRSSRESLRSTFKDSIPKSQEQKKPLWFNRHKRKKSRSTLLKWIWTSSTSMKSPKCQQWWERASWWESAQKDSVLIGKMQLKRW